MLTSETRAPVGAREDFYALVLCYRNSPREQWVGPAWGSKNAAIRSQARITSGERYYGIRPLYRLHVSPKPLLPANESQNEGAADSASVKERA